MWTESAFMQMIIDRRFTQSLEVHRVGFGNMVEVRIGEPEPLASGAGWAGRKITDWARHPLIYSGTSRLVKVGQDGTRETVFERTYNRDSMWGIAGEPESFRFEVDYDSSVMLEYEAARMQFAWIDVEYDNGTKVRRENWLCDFYGDDGDNTPLAIMFHMWGETESWGSESEKTLFIPYQMKRELDH